MTVSQALNTVYEEACWSMPSLPAW